MFYAFRDEVENVTAEEAKACDLSLGYIGVSELDEVVRLFDLPKNGIGTTDISKAEIVFAFALRNAIFMSGNGR